MSDAYSDRPTTPPPAQPDPPIPGKLGSLSQAAREKKLNSVRATLIAIGVLTVLLNGALVFFARSMVKDEINKEIQKGGGMGNVQVNPGQLKQIEDEAVAMNYLVNGVAIALGGLLIVFGVIVKRFPVPVTITSLVLYIAAGLGFGVLNPPTLLQGLLVKIFIVVALSSAIRTALAYERERSREAVPEA